MARKGYIRVPAYDLREGDVLCYENSRWNMRIDSVGRTRDGEQVLVRVGEDGTGTEFFDVADLVDILPR